MTNWAVAKNGSLSARILSGAFWVSVSNVASRGLLMLSMLLTARILGTAHYGELGIIQSSVALFEAVAALGMGVTATRHIAEYRKHDRAKIGTIVTLTQLANLGAGLAIGLLMCLLAPWLAQAVLGLPHLSGLLRISALVLLMNTLAGGYNGILAGFEAYRDMAAANAVTGALSLPLIVGGAYFQGVEGAVAGLAASATVNTVMGRFLVWQTLRREHIETHHLIGAKEWQLLWSFSLPAMLAGIMIAPVNWATSALLINQSGAAEMGLYAAANQWFSVLLFLPGVFTSVYLPIFSSHAATGLLKIVRTGVKTTLYACVPLAAAVFVSSPYIMRLYGQDYAEAYPLLMVVALTSAVAATQNMLSNALAVINRMWLHFASNLLWALVNLGLAHVLLKAGYAALALCVAALLAYFAKLAFTFAIVAKKLDSR